MVLTNLPYIYIRNTFKQNQLSQMAERQAKLRTREIIFLP
jgi:hypothetical protein